jgi:crotonobetainyl-CoA:carnitine CoA-transferase CaiB-like acyl-CoA transferase
MAGVLDGLKVLDLSRGIAGPMAGMLLCDHGAQVTRIEPPGGDPFAHWPGYRVWNRGKRSAIVDLKTASGRQCLHNLAGQADVFVESFAPGVTQRLGIDYPILQALNPRLIYCSITGYGRGTRHSERPAYDALVAARTGLQWEQRGWPGTPMDHIKGGDGPNPELEPPKGCAQGADREGPLFIYSAWPSLNAFYLATLGISAALRAREITGRGQLVETSLLQGCMSACVAAWARVRNPDAPGYRTWVLDRRSPKGLMECAGGRWVHQWPINPFAVVEAAKAGHLDDVTEIPRNRDHPARIGMDPDELSVLFYYYPLMVEAFRKFPAGEWAGFGARLDVGLQKVRTPEEALEDPALLADGCVAEVDDPELGKIRHAGIVYQLDSSPGRIQGPAPKPGQHTEQVRAEADAAAHSARPAAPQSNGARALRAPLDGVTVLDLGLAVAGPFGPKMLADLGAAVIKVNALYDGFWWSNHMAIAVNRGKRSIAVNLKEQRGREIVYKLIERADVVAHNMRYGAPERIGVDYETLRGINPRIIYCHTRGFDRGPRLTLPGTDQSGAALAGIEFEDGGCARGGTPFWSPTSLGDTGNGFLAAIAVVQALYHRERTGQGQKVDAAIINASLLTASYAYVTADGKGAERPRLDAAQTGLSALYRLYETARGWLCLAAVRERHWQALCSAIGRAELAFDSRFDSAQNRRVHDAELSAILEPVFAGRAADEWMELLDRGGVPCEVSSSTFSQELFDDPDLISRQWIASYPRAGVEHIEEGGLLIDFSETPGRIWGPAAQCGEHTCEILAELGYGSEQIGQLCADRIVLDGRIPGAGADIRREPRPPKANRPGARGVER